MNSTIPSNSTGAILCSLDGRRSSKELYMKFFVVHFTTLSFFFHLARRRDGKYLGWSWLLYIVAPSNIVFRYALGLLGIVGFYACKVIHGYIRDGRQSTSPETLYTPIRWLLGKAPDQGYSPLPTSHNGSEIKGEKLAKSIGKAFVIGAFLTQCAGAIFLYHRRHQKDAVTLVDQRVFELACGGLVVGILTLGLSFDMAIFKEPVPDTEKTKIDRFALFCRDSCSEQLLAFEEVDGHWLRLVKNVGISLIVSVVTPNSDIYSGYSQVNKKMLDKATKDPVEPAMYSVSFILIFFCFGFYIPFLLYKEDREHGRLTALTRHPFLRWVLGPICSILMLLGICVVCYLFIGFIITLCLYVLAWFFAFDQVSALSAAPEDIACPMLWSDPLSQWIWWLA